MKKKLVFATNNAHKLDEISSILGEKVELLSLKDIHCHVDIPETADTLEGNAMRSNRLSIGSNFFRMASTLVSRSLSRSMNVNLLFCINELL